MIRISRKRETMGNFIEADNRGRKRDTEGKTSDREKEKHAAKTRLDTGRRGYQQKFLIPL
jgi:hypothetical protein